MKKSVMTIFVISLILLASGLVQISAASSDTVCCEKTTNNLWCQNVASNQCNSAFSAATTSCAQTSFCQLGTCVNAAAGVCTENTGKSECEAKGGTWYKEAKQDIPLCSAGCCEIGDEVAFVSQTECKQLASDYGVDINFHSEITDEPSCLATANSNEKAACVFSDAGTSCSILTKEDCLSKSGKFYDGLLCTAPELATDCAPSSKTTCNGDDVYFLDTCGNLANIYDKKFSPDTADSKKDSQYNNYWTEKDYNKDILNLEGDCDYAAGSTCSTERGVSFCKDLSCDNVLINGKEVTKQHGESWCAETNGTLHHIRVDPETMEWINPSQRQELIDNYEKYDTPGSRYVRLQCWEGEVIEEPCADYRNEVCKEADIGTKETGEFTTAQCRVNGWRTCMDLTTQSACEDDYIDCQWMPGYRFDLKEVDEIDRDEEQGSCVPLFAPGFDFWNADSSGTSVCDLGKVSEAVAYETNWVEKRDKLQYDLSKASENCVDNCYALPGYGDDASLSYLEGLHKGTQNLNNDYDISNRLGFYCWKDENGNTSKVGKAGLFGSKIKCAQDESKRKLPVFYQNKQWLDFITKRAAALGDCGYKSNLVGTPGQNSTEIINALFQKLSQSGEVKSNTTVKEIFEGDSWTGEDERTDGLKYVPRGGMIKNE